MWSLSIPLIWARLFDRGPIYQTANKQWAQMLTVDTCIRSEATCTYQNVKTKDHSYARGKHSTEDLKLTFLQTQYSRYDKHPQPCYIIAMVFFLDLENNLEHVLIFTYKLRVLSAEI